MVLNKKQKQFVLDNYQDTPDLAELTKKVFGNNKLDGRTKEGRAVRAFLVNNNLTFNVTKLPDKKEPIVLTEEQGEFVLQRMDEGVSSYGIAKLIFPDKDVKKLGLEQRAVLAWLKENKPEFSPAPGLSFNVYNPPKAASRIIKRINESTGEVLEEDRLSRQHQICIDKLRTNLANTRFLKIINGYKDESDRILFEEEFIRLTWDKPDLSADEINLYMNMCKSIINLEVISQQVQKLNKMFDDAGDQDEMTIRLAEIIKTKSTEYKDCENMIANLTKKLQGDRAERLKSRRKDNASFLSIVEEFQDEEGRKNMVRMAEMNKKAVKDEGARLESMDEWKARILGIGIDDVI